MANMSYCRFQNTARDLADVVEHWGDDISESELKAKQRILRLSRQIVDIEGDLVSIGDDDD